MSKGNTTENDLMLLLFNKTLPSYLGTLATSGNADFYLSLHTGDPGEAGTQSTSEANYDGYSRVAVSRAASGWTVADNQSENTSLVQFPLCSGGSSVCSYVSVGVSASGAGQILYSGSLNSPRTISDGIQPQFSGGDLIFEED